MLGTNEVSVLFTVSREGNGNSPGEFVPIAYQGTTNNSHTEHTQNTDYNHTSYCRWRKTSMMKINQRCNSCQSVIRMMMSMMIMVCKKVLHRDFIGKRKKDFLFIKGASLM